MTWGCANQYLVSQLKLWELLTHHWLLLLSPHLSSPLVSSPLASFNLLSSPLRFTASGPPPAVTLHLCLPNDLISPFTSIHTISQSLSLLSPKGSQDWGLRGKRADWVCPPWLLCLLSPSLFSSFSSWSLFPLSFSLLCCLSSLYLLVTSLLFTSLYLHPPESNLNKQCCSLFTLMCRLGPDGAGYVGGILMAVGERTKLVTQRHLADGQ